MKQRVLITGGTGFLGRALGILLKSDYTVLLTGRNNKQNFKAEKETGCQVLPMDITRAESVRDGFAEFKPDIVIHAAASKFVDLAEKQPMECIDVNVLGSQIVARTAIDYRVKSLIGVSTDKAASPTRNLYGMTKTLMERMYCGLEGKTDTRFVCVRFGNLAWSTGSVFPIWKMMHTETGVIKSTGPDMTRFFITVKEAADIVLTALNHVELLRGKVLTRGMRAAKIRDILDVWIQEKGGTWDQIQGRPGDFPYECLIGELETDITQVLNIDGKPHYALAYNQKVSHPLPGAIASHTSESLSRDEIKNLILDAPIED